MTARHLLVLVTGVIAISWAAPLIRLAEPAPALAIAALRLVIAAPPMVGIALWRGERDLGRIEARDRWLLALSAVALAAHFAFWVVSVQRTSILASVVLVTMQPLFVAIGAWLFLQERPTREVNLGIALGIAGAALLVGAGASDAGTLTGNLFALIGGVMSSVYLVIGRGARRRLSTATYGAVVYSLTAVLLVGLAVATGTALGGHPASSYAYIVLLALVPQLIGHNAMNWALGSLSAAVVAVAILGEPVGSALIAAVLLDEVPTLLEAAGGAVVLAGVYVALRGARRAELAAGMSRPIEV
ncbi:MAG: DMT family transporter [Chloroflexi bacterium]|nr:DMT family transporter [Chloroflexota bacterium]